MKFITILFAYIFIIVGLVSAGGPGVGRITETLPPSTIPTTLPTPTTEEPTTPAPPATPSPSVMIPY